MKKKIKVKVVKDFKLHSISLVANPEPGLEINGDILDYEEQEIEVEENEITEKEGPME